MYPKLKFKISCKKDVQAFFGFVKDAEYDSGRNLEWAIFKLYPIFKKYKKDGSFNVSKKIVSDFVKNKYSQNATIIKKRLKLYKDNWKRVEKDYYHLVNQLIPLSYWPKGKYIAYPTIWGMFPKYLEDKTFLVPFQYKNEQYINTIIAHEMLHFIFYNYFFKKYPKYKNEKYDFFVWHISEIFNGLVQNSPQWLKVFKTKSINYPEHNKIIKQLKNKYYKKEIWDTDKIIKDIIAKLF